MVKSMGYILVWLHYALVLSTVLCIASEKKSLFYPNQVALARVTLPTTKSLLTGDFDQGFITFDNNKSNESIYLLANNNGQRLRTIIEKEEYLHITRASIKQTFFRIFNAIHRWKESANNTAIGQKAFYKKTKEALYFRYPSYSMVEEHFGKDIVAFMSNTVKTWCICDLLYTILETEGASTIKDIYEGKIVFGAQQIPFDCTKEEYRSIFTNHLAKKLFNYATSSVGDNTWKYQQDLTHIFATDLKSDIKNEYGMTPLDIAHRYAKINYDLLRNFKIQETNVDANELFYQCTQRFDYPAIQKILANNHDLVNIQDEHGTTPLMHIVLAHTEKRPINIPCFKNILNHKPNLSLRNKNGHSLFSLIVSKEITHLFLDILAHYSNEQIRVECTNIPVSAKIPLKKSCNTNAILRGEKRVDNPNNWSGNTALHTKCQNKEIGYIIALLRQGANLEIENKERQTPYNLLSDALLSSHAYYIPFILREAFNKPHFLDAKYVILQEFFKKSAHATCKDIAVLIQKKVTDLVVNLLSTTEALLWKQTYKQNPLHTMQGYLLHILLLPPEEKTTFNKSILLQEKEIYWLTRRN